MIVTTTNDVADHKIVRYLGVVRGITVRSRNVFGTIGAQFQKAHRMKPEEFRSREGARRFGEEILKLQEQGVTIDVKGAFRVAPRTSFRGRTVLLVDDVMTTGSTMHEAARVLKAAGAARVVVAVLARAGN